MPRVKEEYLEQKKDQIADAALAVCRRKPLFAVTMQDIIDETKFSQGAIYRYYQDLDEILAAVLNRFYESVNFQEEAEAIFDRNEKPEELLRLLFECLAKYMGDSHLDYCKLLLELNMIYMAYPDRAAKYRRLLKEQVSYDFVLQKCFNLIRDQTELGYFTPRIPLDDIIAFAVASYDGIMKDVTMVNCYHQGENLPAYTRYDEKRLLRTLCRTILNLLGGSEY